MRVLHAAPVLHLASLDAYPVSAGAVGVLASFSMPQLTELQLWICNVHHTRASQCSAAAAPQLAAKQLQRPEQPARFEQQHHAAVFQLV